MTSDDMKAAIERAMRHECCSLVEYDTVMALAEVGRLAVEWARAGRTPGRVDDYIAAETAAVDAADAFLDKHGGGG